MKWYLVSWGSEEKEFVDIHTATEFAEMKGFVQKINTYVWVVNDGVRDKEPFLSCEWGM